MITKYQEFKALNEKKSQEDEYILPYMNEAEAAAVDEECKKICDTITEEEESEFVIENLAVSAVGMKGKTYYIEINGKMYGYEPLAGTTDELAGKFAGMLKYSAGKALAWLKKNSNLVHGSMKDGKDLAAQIKAGMANASGKSEKTME